MEKRENNSRVVWITATRNRTKCLERVVRCFLDQDYKGELSLWIFNNSEVPFTLHLGEEKLPENRRILVTHKFLDTFTNEPYRNVGCIFNDIIEQIPHLYMFTGYTPDIITFADDDDIYLPSHISEGVKGMRAAWRKKCLAYKPYYSYFKDSKGISLTHNNLEPSIFIDAEYISGAKCRETAVDYHDGWIVPLKEDGKFFEGSYPKFKPTLIYDWSGEIPVYKISGTGDNSESNYEAYKSWSRDVGDGRIIPMDKERADKYYKMANVVG